ncbi:hypothetical protein CTEN210_06448 [Chaetoceros tenuissimus]|uniref:START domain-containing protein n=1 Tax=Chaetoceros tenuissimus TaxID=426638 RepID=A0AAD3CQ13_9STRA|nr:hypothetical protein CTEN210_06448 [Chaetoceros tenuissimus]
MSRVVHFMILIPVMISIFVHYKIILPPTKWATNTGGSLLGEEYLQSKQDAFQYAAKAVKEGYSIWNEPSTNWETMYKNIENQLHVESRRITQGPFAKSGILLTRATGTIEGANAEKVYNHFITPEGLLLLDPSMDVKKAAEYIERYTKDNGTYLDVHKSYNPMPPGITDRYHLVLNGYYTKEKFFFCKSIVHDAIPGSSPYFHFANETESTLNEPINDEHGVRAVNTFYFHIEPTLDKKSSIVRMVNFVDFQMGSTPMNWLISKGFFPGVFERMEEMFGDRSGEQE